MNGQFSKTENSYNTDLLWIKDIFCITVNCDEVKWTLSNMPWKRKACNLQKYCLTSLLLIRPFSYPYFFKMWPSFYPSSLQLFGKIDGKFTITSMKLYTLWRRKHFDKQMDFNVSLLSSCYRQMIWKIIENILSFHKVTFLPMQGTGNWISCSTELNVLSLKCVTL